MTAEQQKKENEKAARAANKTFYLSMVKHHEGEVLRWKQKADDAEPLELTCSTSPGDFAGL